MICRCTPASGNQRCQPLVGIGRERCQQVNEVTGQPVYCGCVEASTTEDQPKIHPRAGGCDHA